MNVLSKVHEALVPGGLVVDTQPISRRPIVKCAGRRVGSLDMTAWGRTIDQVERPAQQTIRSGLFRVIHEERFAVTDRFDTGAELVETASGWVGTAIPPAQAERLAGDHSQASVKLVVRLRVLAAHPALATV